MILSKNNIFLRCYISTLIAFIRIASHLFAVINFRLFYRFVSVICFFLPKNIILTFNIVKNLSFSIPLNDQYYLRFISNKFKYENEINIFLNCLNKQFRYDFIDCGANYGYWSIMASTYKFIDKIISVEPSNNNIFFLKKNLSNNIAKTRYQIINKALFTKNNTIVNFGGSNYHTDLHVIQGPSQLQVKTITLDNLILEARKKNKIIIKLDIEGLELDVIKYSIKELDKIDVLIYEDHGSDPTHKITSFLLSKKMLIYYYTDNKFELISNIQQLSFIKTQKTKGYNFFSMHPKKFENIISKNTNFENPNNT